MEVIGRGKATMSQKGGSFKNIKLGKNVYRQLKRRGPPAQPPKREEPKVPGKPRR